MNQKEIREQLKELHDIDAEQVEFSTDGTPIFNYEAICLLALRLTDLQSIDCCTAHFDNKSGSVTANCRVTLPDGRDRSTSASAYVGETLQNGKTIENMVQCEAIANTRAARRGIRSAGINLWKAHLNFVATGQGVTAHTRYAPDHHLITEIHTLATKSGLLTKTDRTRYEKFLALQFDGRISSADLSTDEKRRLVELLRCYAVA